MGMKLSIIVPVYNVEDYLPKCVDSLLVQTIGDFEIFLVDDGSKDHSGEIADRYAAEHPDIIRTLHTTNGGQGRARNLALPLAQGDYIGFVDSDDWVRADMYEKLYSCAVETGADIVYCDFLEHWFDGREALLPAAFQDHPMSAAGSSCNKIFRRSLIGDLRFPEGLWYEDFYFSAVMMARSSHTEYIHEPLYIYRRGQESTMNNNNARKNLDMLKILDLLEQELLGLGRREDFHFFLINHLVLDSISRLARQETEEKKEVIAALRAYAHKKLPHLLSCESYRAESRNRRIIMFLNYYGLEDAAQRLLRMNAKRK